MKLLTGELEDYILKHIDPEDELLAELYRKTHAGILNPHMLAGHLQGKIIEMISHMIRPRVVLEIGTYTGYSTLCLVKGLKNGGILYTIDINDEIESFTRSFLEKSPQNSMIRYFTGDALKLIPEIKGNFDLVYIDGDKSEYLSYYRAVINRVNPGGYVLADNVLWDGKVVQLKANHDRATKGMMAFNDYVHNDPGVQHVILPVRDGLMLIRKLN